jgi:hypothetical protein
MANLATISVSTNGEYQKLSTLADITFTSGNSYTLQIQGGMVYLREGTTGKGFLLTSSNPFTYVASGDDLYIKVDYNNAIINIAE